MPAARTQIGEDQRQRAIGRHPRHARPAQAFRRRLGRGRLAVAGKAAGRGKIAGAGHLIGPGETAGTVHLDVAENEHGLQAAIGGGKLHVGRRIAHEEADAVVKGRVELRNARHEQG